MSPGAHLRHIAGFNRFVPDRCFHLARPGTGGGIKRAKCGFPIQTDIRSIDCINQLAGGVRCKKSSTIRDRPGPIHKKPVAKKSELPNDSSNLSALHEGGAPRPDVLHDDPHDTGR